MKKHIDLMKIPEEKPEFSKKFIIILSIVVSALLIFCFASVNMPLLRKRIILGIFAGLAILWAVIDFLWDLVLPTKARKKRIAADIQGGFYWLQDYGYEVEKVSFLKNKNIQVIYSNENLCSVSVFWDNAIKRCVLTLAVDGNGTWEEFTFVGRESFNMDWYSDEFADLTYREYCEKVFDALGICGE